MSEPDVIYTEKQFYLLEKLSEGIEDLKASGLIEFWYERGLRKFRKKKEENQRKPLSSEDVKGCFMIILTGITSSLIVFFYEVTHKIIKFHLFKVHKFSFLTQQCKKLLNLDTSAEETDLRHDFFELIRRI